MLGLVMLRSGFYNLPHHAEEARDNYRTVCDHAILLSALCSMLYMKLI